MKIKEDREGNFIGNGDYHVDYTVFTFEEYSHIQCSVSQSETTETVYVHYTNTENGQSITVRFSNHTNNATKLGDQLNGIWASKDEILFHLGLKQRKFIPETSLFIEYRSVSKKIWKPDYTQ